MMVTFVSQCEKKALKRTRRVLDAFASRIGNNTWQTVITQEGLNAVRKLLRKTASKNTAVSCHWIRDRSRSELLWVVGKRDEFSHAGVVPVHTTTKNIANNQWQNNWHYLPLIRVATALAALFHDLGKATICFQEKLKKTNFQADPLRHEWISCLLLHAFVQHCCRSDKSSDIDWLDALSKGNIDENMLKNALKDSAEGAAPLYKLPPLATIVAWLVLTHHRLPLPPKESLHRYKDPLPEYQQLLKALKADFDYNNPESEIDIKDCLAFANGFLSNSIPWIREVKKWASKALKRQDLLADIVDSGGMRVVLFYSRLSLMLGDHSYSSQGADSNWKSVVELFANTESGKLKQKLDEHLVGVLKSALSIVNCLPLFETELPVAKETKSLRIKSPRSFEWQDKAVRQINQWRRENNHTEPEDQFGFFAVNMASTGKGKTFANAKIMHALSSDCSKLRYILALGLRTLTLQTGDEYKNRLGLTDNDLAVLIGSKAVLDLHNQGQETKYEQSEAEKSGSESTEELLKEEFSREDIYYDTQNIPEKYLKTILRKGKDRHFLYAPVLACTIDHIIMATETTRGGRHILPSLRLMSSDLVIDEIDDFDVNDLKAIGRLIHLVGLLGRKAMISSATIPPDLAKGLFHAYRQGWLLFATSRGISQNVGCAWVDEFRTNVSTISYKSGEHCSFSCLHDQFVQQRVRKLREEKVKRKAVISVLEVPHENDVKTLEKQYFESVKQYIEQMHEKHFIVDEISTVQVSFGVVRVANIKPCVNLARYLLEEAEWRDDVNVKVMAYHSQQVLLMRNEQEKHLDVVLKRKNPQAAFENPIIKEHLSERSAKNMIYILVATPVEEVGRDHDFDWAVVEPSSYRSIIQLAGRVLRHRNKSPVEPSIMLMQYNLKGYIQKYSDKRDNKPVFYRPGYETYDNRLISHDLKQIVCEEDLNHSVDAIPRIQPNKKLTPKKNLVDLEHVAIKNALNTPDNRGAGNLEGWLTQYWWLTGIPQRLYRFRDTLPGKNIYLVPDNDNPDRADYAFCQKDATGCPVKIEIEMGIEHREWDDSQKRLWLYRDYAKLLTDIAQEQNLKIEDAGLRYGELCLAHYNDSDNYFYSPQFGLVRK